MDTISGLGKRLERFVTPPFKAGNIFEMFAFIHIYGNGMRTKPGKLPLNVSLNWQGIIEIAQQLQLVAWLPQKQWPTSVRAQLCGSWCVAFCQYCWSPVFLEHLGGRGRVEGEEKGVHGGAVIPRSQGTRV